MKSVAAVVLLFALAPGQERARLRKLDIRGSGPWTLEFSLEGDASAVTLRRYRHEYGWTRKELQFAPDPDGWRIESRKGKVDVANAGLYEISFGSEALAVPVGDPRTLRSGLEKDTGDCVTLIVKALDLFDRIDRESSENGWEKKSEAVLREIERLKLLAAPKTRTSLHAATYKAIVDVLDELQKVGRMIAFLKQQNRGRGSGPEPEPEDEHAGNGPQIRGLEGRPLNLDGAKNRIDLCDELRVREYYSWILVLEGVALDRKDGEAFNEELERAYRSLLEGKSGGKLAEFSRYEVEGVEQNYVEFFARMREYGRNPDAETKKSLRVHLAAAGEKVMGRKRSP